MAVARRALAWSGLAGATLGVSTTLLATALSPTFSSTASALSDLGAAGAPTALLFNGGLLAAGLVTLPFAVVLWSVARNLAERGGAVLVAATAGALALVGTFPTGTALHLPVSVAYFVLLSFALWVHGSGAVLAGDARRGLAAVWLGLGNVAAWGLWVVSGLEGVALPELVGSLALLAWLALTTRWLLAAGWVGASEHRAGTPR